MRGLLISLLLLSSAFIVFGEESFDVQAFKQLVMSTVNNKITPSNAKSCDPNTAVGDISSKCGTTVTGTCNVIQNYLNCAWDVMYKDCGNSNAKDFCTSFNQQYGGQFTSCNLHCSASSILISGSIGALLLYKMVLEKFFFNL